MVLASARCNSSCGVRSPNRSTSASRSVGGHHRQTITSADCVRERSDRVDGGGAGSLRRAPWERCGPIVVAAGSGPPLRRRQAVRSPSPGAGCSTGRSTPPDSPPTASSLVVPAGRRATPSPRPTSSCAGGRHPLGLGAGRPGRGAGADAEVVVVHDAARPLADAGPVRRGRRRRAGRRRRRGAGRPRDRHARGAATAAPSTATTSWRCRRRRRSGPPPCGRAPATAPRRPTTRRWSRPAVARWSSCPASPDNLQDHRPTDLVVAEALLRAR